ncbi:hypothetical protein GUJ93_ZPchr0012g21847 [Zizania palustris]|uniref:BHLH domain-containing protein n=1 Tax=Zizania palustris TaxID=103762 RepID=A0A8J6BR04_ZIZPA|nr:hypothetical protein GUJ93_ZPchr0012g21847 [Zizania palustris]
MEHVLLSSQLLSHTLLNTRYNSHTLFFYAEGFNMELVKRRVRINERLKILQNLVSNETKIDISTMLEKADHYVKFLQLQIKLLSSNEMWMFAPTAYNGMNIGIVWNRSGH